MKARRTKARELPRTPYDVRRFAERATVSDSARAIVGALLVLADRIESLDASQSRALDVLLKQHSSLLLAAMERDR